MFKVIIVRGGKHNFFNQFDNLIVRWISERLGIKLAINLKELDEINILDYYNAANIFLSSIKWVQMYSELSNNPDTMKSKAITHFSNYYWQWHYPCLQEVEIKLSNYCPYFTWTMSQSLSTWSREMTMSNYCQYNT